MSTFDTDETKDDEVCYNFLFFGDSQKDFMREITESVIMGHIALEKSLFDAFKYFKFDEKQIPKDAQDAMFKAFRHMWKLIKEGKYETDIVAISITKTEGE